MSKDEEALLILIGKRRASQDNIDAQIHRLKSQIRVLEADRKRFQVDEERLWEEVEKLREPEVKPEGTCGRCGRPLWSIADHCPCEDCDQPDQS